LADSFVVLIGCQSIDYAGNLRESR